ncbi:hypothetical protein BKA62DRAFT_722325 [Auriculariales sp. MPI-PUGE-AT-0066]|nr:hypothetical protein BKA62DRAFT_722325 [Auriculariales sp. MPI-PUGE-AT-0066]
MDQLLSHVLREIAFDGELGCSVSRFTGFISGYYASQSTSMPQLVDDAFSGYVWSLLVALPSVRVGLVPSGVNSEVIIAPRPMAKAKKPKKKKEEDDGDDMDVVEDVDAKSAKLEDIPDVSFLSLQDLVNKFGSSLRMAADERAIFKALTGSHHRPSKLSPMVYTALQLICRGRQLGISVHALGQATGYDQKMCHYLCKQLLALNLILKLPKPGIGANFVVHKYFVDHSPEWSRIRAEEQDPMLAPVTGAAAAAEDDEDDDEDDIKLKFRTMDDLDLSSDVLFRARVMTVMQALAAGGAVRQKDLLKACGTPGKNLRSFCEKRLDVMVTDGLIDAVMSQEARRVSGMPPRSYRLPAAAAASLASPTAAQQQQELSVDPFEPLPDDKLLPADETLQFMILQTVEKKGTSGITLRELTEKLCGFDKRTIELHLGKLEKTQPPRPFAHVRIVATTEQSGRNRRFRYYLERFYQQVAQREGIIATSAPVASTSAVIYPFQPPEASVEPVGPHDFLLIEPANFYNSQKELEAFYAAQHESFDAWLSSGRAKAGPHSNPLDASGRPMVGRPRKEWRGGLSTKPSTSRQSLSKDEEAKMTASSRKRKTKASNYSDDFEEDCGPPVPKKRGRPRKVDTDDGETVPKKRGRPRKSDTATVAAATSRDNSPQPGPATTAAGRPARVAKRKRDAAESPAEDEPEPARKKTKLGPSQGDGSTFALPKPTHQQETAANAQPSTATPVATGTGATAARSAQSGTNIGKDQPEEKPLGVQNNIDEVVEGMQLHQDFGAAAASAPNSSPLSSSLAKQLAKRVNNELVKLAELNGGFMSTFGKMFSEAYVKLTDEMLARGDSISGNRGVALDRRTLSNTLESLQNQGRIHVIKATTTVYHLRDLSQEKINAFIAALSSTVIVASSAAIGSATSADAQLEESTAASQRKDKTLLAELLQGNHKAVRDAFLTEQQTVTQLYGYLKGKASRAKELHCFTLSQLASDSDSPSKHFVSRKDRIVSFSYFFHDLPLASYCSLVPISKYEEQLEQRLRERDTMLAPVHSLPPELAKSLEIGRAKATYQINELLHILAVLGLVVPLIPSKSATPEFQVAADDANNLYPSAYDRFHPTNDAKLRARFYRFTTSASLFHFAAEGQPYLFDRSVETADLSMVFWKDLKIACISPAAQHVTQWNPNAPTNSCSDDIVRMLKRDSSWTDTYAMTWYQQEYLKTHIDVQALTTPWDDQDPQKRYFRHLCYTSCIPQQVAIDFFTREIEALRRVQQRMKGATIPPKVVEFNGEIGQLTPEVSQPRGNTSSRSMSKRREIDWADAIRNVHRGPLSDAMAEQLQPLKDQFFKTAMKKKTLETQMVMFIARHVQGLVGPPPTANIQTQAPHFVATTLPPAQKTPSDSTPVAEIVEAIRAKNEADQERRRKGVNEEAADPAAEDEINQEDSKLPGPKPPTRRRRFGWTAQFDDLALDVAAVLRARSTNGRIDWTACGQAFPGMDRNSVRSRVSNLRSEPGGDSYAQRLETAFRALLDAHRGSEDLLDPNPKSTNDFPLVQHVEFLRKYVDKQAVRVGLGAPQGKATVQLLWNDVEAFSDKWKIESKAVSTTAGRRTFEFLWSAISEEQREKEFYREAFLLPPVAMPSQLTGDWSNTEVVEATLKMMLSTPEDRFSSDISSEMLKHFGEDAVKTAVEKLRREGKISAIQSDPKKPRPGRTLKISDSDRVAFSSWLSLEMAEDAVALDALHEVAEPDDWQEWTPMATDGETAAFLRMIANDEVELDIDLSSHKAAKKELEWNSRKADDGNIEAAIAWRPKQAFALSSSIAPEVEMSDDAPINLSQTQLDHGVALNGAAASCAAEAEQTIVDCSACLDASMTHRLSQNADRQNAILLILNALQQGGAVGLTRWELENFIGIAQARIIWPTVDLLAKGPVPILMWTGYDTARIVYCGHADTWTAALSRSSGDGEQTTLARLWPRRWLDIQGRLTEESWQAAVRAVASVIQLRPGIPQTELRAKFEALLDRQELNDVLRYLTRSGVLRCTMTTTGIPESLYEVDVVHESFMFWTMNPRKRWYNGLMDVGAP